MQSALRRDNNGFIFAILTTIVFLAPFLVQMTKNSMMKLLEDLTYLIVLLISVYYLSRKKDISIHLNRSVMIFVFVFLVFTMIGLYYSGVSLVILQIREFKYLLLLIILLPYNKLDDFKYVWPILKMIAAICVPVSIAQWIVLKSQGDYISGIMGYKESGTLTLFLLIIFFTEFMLRLKNNKSIFGWYFLFLLPTALNETKITMFLVPLMFFSSLYLCGKLKLKYILNICVVVVVLGTGWAIMYEKTSSMSGENDYTYQDSAFAIFSPTFLKDYFYASDWEGDAGRMTKVLLALDIIKDKPMFGYGIGASYGGLTSGINGFIYEQYSSPKMLGGTRPQVVMSIIDLGILGFVIVLLVLISLFVKVLRVRHFSIEKILAMNSFIIIVAAVTYSQIFYLGRLMFIYILFTYLCLRFRTDR